MVRVAIDSNVLVYAELEPDSEKGRRAGNVIARATRDGVIPTQVLGEFLSVVLRKKPDALPEALLQAADYTAAVETPTSTLEAVREAASVARDRKLQFWDCVICVVAAQAGATALFTEDLQDGSEVRGLRIVNPFDPKNDEMIGKILSP